MTTRARLGSVLALLAVVLTLAAPANARPVADRTMAPAGSVVLPLPPLTYRMTSAQGPRCIPIVNASATHLGQDLGALDGTPIHAVAAGRVVTATVMAGGGHYIQLEHTIDGATVSSVYSHMWNALELVSVGQWVGAGQMIARVGSSGVSTQPHLHVEIWSGRAYAGGTVRDPVTWLQSHGVSLAAGATAVTQTPPPATCRYYATASLNVRQSASSTAAVLTTVPAGAVLTGYPGGKQGDFLRVTVNGVTGWAAAAFVSPTRSGQSSGDRPTQFFSVPYSSTLFYYGSDGKPRPAVFAQWDAAGRPSPQPIPTDVVRYSWSGTLYAVSFFSGAWWWHQLSFGEWDRMGRPHARPVAEIGGTTYFRWATSTELFAAAPDGAVRKLSHAEWTAVGNPWPTDRVDQGYARLTWQSTVGRFTSLSAGRGSPVGYAQWEAENFPTPMFVPRFAGDRFCTTPGSTALRYVGPTYSTNALTYAQWQAAGAPWPTAC